MKKKNNLQYKIQNPTITDRDFKLLIEGIIAQRQYFLDTGSPYPLEEQNSKKDENRKQELNEEIEKCKNRIKELENTREIYKNLLNSITNEENKVKSEQKNKHMSKSETSTTFVQHN